MRVMDVGGGAVPRTDQPPWIQDEAEFASHNPPMITLAFLAHLRWAAPFPHGVDQLDAIAVSDTQHGGSGQKASGPRRVWVLKSRAKRVRSGTCGNNGR